jgi:hypothetical protein
MVETVRPVVASSCEDISIAPSAVIEWASWQISGGETPPWKLVGEQVRVRQRVGRVHQKAGILRPSRLGNDRSFDLCR